MGTIAGKTIFTQAKCVIVRPQKEQYLFYNSHTDELHLIPPSGYSVYIMCDGVKTIDDIFRALFAEFGATLEIFREHLLHFFGELEVRGLVERVHGT